MRVEPLTPERWGDFVDLFMRPGPRGGKGLAANGCWCMWWRGRGRSHEQNREAMERLVHEGRAPGLLAYDDRIPVGWVSVDRRENYVGLMRSRDYRPIDDEDGIWSVTCLFVHGADRRRGIGDLLVEEAIAHAFERGATAIEAYPMSPGKRNDYMGSFSRYARLGFVPVREAGVRTLVRLVRA